MSPLEDRLVRLLTTYRFPPIALGVREDAGWAVFTAGTQAVTVQAAKGPGITDATIATALITLATEQGIRPTPN